MLTAASANPLKNSIAHPWLPAAEEKKILTNRYCTPVFGVPDQNGYS